MNTTLSERLRIAEIIDFSDGSKPLRPDAELSISATQAAQKKWYSLNPLHTTKRYRRTKVVSAVDVSQDNSL